MENKMGDLIAKKRKEKGMTQKELADKLFITDRAVSKWERNLRYPDISLLKNICEILDLSISELINGEEIGEIDDKMIDKTLDDGIRIYSKKNRRKFLKIFSVVCVSILLLLVIVINLIAEYNYGEINFLDTSISIPNSHIRAARRKTDKVMKAIESSDIEYLESVVVPNDLSDGLKLTERLDKFYNTFKVISWERADLFYYNGHDYVITYKLKLELNSNYIEINPYLIANEDTVILDSFAFEDDLCDQHHEEWKLLMTFFNHTIDLEYYLK